MHTLGAAPQLARGLRAAEQQLAKNGGFAAVEVESFLQPMLVLGDATVRGADRTRQRIVIQCAKCTANGVFVQIHDRIAIGFLVARVDERIQGKRIIIRCGDFLFPKSGENSDFDFIQYEVHRLKYTGSVRYSQT